MTFDTEDMSEVESYKSDPGSSNDDDPLWADDPEKAYLKSMLNDNDDGPGDSLIGESTLGDIMGNGGDDDDNTDNNTIPTRDTYGYTPRSRDTYGFSPQSNKTEDDSYGYTPQKDIQNVKGGEEEEKKEEGQQQVDGTIIISPVKQSKSIVVGEIVLPSSGLTVTDNDTLDNITAADNDTLDNLTADTGLQYQYHQQQLQRQLQQPPPSTVLSSVDDNDPEAALARVYNQQGDPGQQDIPPPVAMIPRTPENFKTRPYHSSRELPVVKVDEELPPAGNGVAGVPPNGVAPPSFIFVTPGHSSAVKTKERPSATGGGGGNGTAARLKNEKGKNKSSSGSGPGGGPPQDSNNKKDTAGGGETPRGKKDPKDAGETAAAGSNNRRGTLSGRFYCRVAIIFLLLAVIISMVLLVLVLSEKLNDGSEDPTSIEDGSGGENNNPSPNAWPTIPPGYTFPPATFEPTGPTEAPTITREPSSEPTGSPSTSPTNPPPTTNPTNPPVIGPTESPTKNPTEFPTLSPTNEPSLSPTDTPTSIPTQNPSENPTTLSPTMTLSPTDGLLNEAITGLVEVSPESELALSDETSPQYRALEWAIQDSQLRSPPITTNAITDLGGGGLRQRQRDLRRRRRRRNLQEDTQFIQRWVLATFYYSTNGDNWNDNTSWLTSDDECTWYEVSCNGENEISSLTLRENNLFGPMPLELHLLSNSLEFLHLNSNDLTGGIPTTFGRLINLERISLTLNQLSGSVPSELGGMASLRLFGLGRNDLSGPLPPELGNLESLESFDLSVNNVQGTIPTEYGELSLLETFKLHRNGINGQLPSELGNLRRLKSFEADRNSIGGTIPSEFGGMNDLESLILNDNEISGEIPETLGDLENLEVLDVSENNLSGVVPEPVCELPMAEITADCEEVTCTCCDICCVDGDGCKENDQMPIETPLPATPPPTTPAPTQSPPSTCVTEVSTNKDCYENGDDIVVSFTDCDVDESDFVGVYQARTDLSDLDGPIAFRYVCEDQDCEDGEVASGSVRFNNARGRGSFIIILVREDDDYEALSVGNEFSLAEDSC